MKRAYALPRGSQYIRYEGWMSNEEVMSSTSDASLIGITSKEQANNFAATYRTFRQCVNI